jgi:hypothetical protein
VLIQQRTILSRVEARVIQRLAFKTSDRLSVCGTACKHQSCARRGVLPKNRKHLPLVVRAQVEETVPRNDPVEWPSERERAHVGHDPFVRRETIPAEIDQGGRRVHPGDVVSGFDQIAGDRHGRSASDIQDRRRGRHQPAKPVEPGFLHQAAATFPIPDPFQRPALIQIDDPRGL